MKGEPGLGPLPSLPSPRRARTFSRPAARNCSTARFTSSGPQAATGQVRHDREAALAGQGRSRFQGVSAASAASAAGHGREQGLQTLQFARSFQQTDAGRIVLGRKKLQGNETGPGTDQFQNTHENTSTGIPAVPNRKHGAGPPDCRIRRVRNAPAARPRPCSSGWPGSRAKPGSSGRSPD